MSRLLGIGTVFTDRQTSRPHIITGATETRWEARPIEPPEVLERVPDGRNVRLVFEYPSIIGFHEDYVADSEILVERDLHAPARSSQVRDALINAGIREVEPKSQLEGFYIGLCNGDMPFVYAVAQADRQREMALLREWETILSLAGIITVLDGAEWRHLIPLGVESRRVAFSA